METGERGKCVWSDFIGCVWLWLCRRGRERGRWRGRRRRTRRTRTPSNPLAARKTRYTQRQEHIHTETHVFRTHRKAHLYIQAPHSPCDVLPESLFPSLLYWCSWWMWSWRRTWQPSRSMTPHNRESSHRHSYDTHSYRYNEHNHLTPLWPIRCLAREGASEHTRNLGQTHWRAVCAV